MMNGEAKAGADSQAEAWARYGTAMNAEGKADAGSQAEARPRYGTALKGTSS